jgi:hypothetical protein
VDNGISEMLNSVLSNPESLGKIMAMMPAVAQMMNAGSPNPLNNQEPAPVAALSAPAPSNTDTAAAASDITANAEVMNALKNLVAVLNSASSASVPSSDAAVPAMAAITADNNSNNNNNNIAGIAEKIEQIEQIEKTAEKPDTAGIEKTLDALKNFSSATSPENNHRTKLLLAIKPFLKDGRKTKIDTAIKYMNAAKIISMFGKNGFV